MSRMLGYATLIAYVLTVYFSNVVIDHFGIVSVGFGQVAPAAVYVVGVAFLLRDAVQELVGRKAVVLAILAGAALSYTVSPTFATASAIAFLASESCDFLVYTPLSKRSTVAGVVASNIVGALIDSYIFLTLAFHSLAFFNGQVFGKLWVTAAFIPVLLASRRCVTRLA